MAGAWTTFILILVTSAVVACSGSNGTDSISGNPNLPLAVPQVNEAIAVSDASVAQCPNGGKVYTVFRDSNGNGQLDTDESVLSAQTVCNSANGLNGADGLSTLFAMNPVSVGPEACASGSGLQIDFGLDANRNGELDPAEINQTQILCNGMNGAVGAAGPAGSNGASVVFQVLPAAPAICPAGGSTILMALDVNGAGIYSAMDPGQQSASLCNGVNGQDGKAGAIPAYTPVAPILPCGNTVAYKEVLLRLGNGQVLASFSDNASGANTRFAFLPDGSYIDTDSSGCNFDLSTSSDGATRFISWLGQIQMSWALNP